MRVSIIKKLKLAFFFLALIFLISGAAPKIFNAKGLGLVRSSFQVPEIKKAQSGIFAPVVPAILPSICNPQTEDFCIVEGNFILKPPVNSRFSDNYKYGLTDEGRREPHHGVDFPAAIGTPVLASADGKIVFAGFEKNSAHGPDGYFYGNFIVIRHANELYTLYAHLSKIFVEAGQRIQVGELIGEVGQTGAAIGPHLHFEVRRGANGTDYFSTENPELWLELSADENSNLTGVLSVLFDAGLTHKIERNIVVEYYPEGVVLPQESIHTFTYPAGFENNAEDAVISNLLPGRYRIVVRDNSGNHDRWVIVEAGKLTQAYINLH